jgi:hypothetical protein
MSYPKILGPQLPARLSPVISQPIKLNPLLYIPPMMS